MGIELMSVKNMTRADRRKKEKVVKLFEKGFTPREVTKQKITSNTIVYKWFDEYNKVHGVFELEVKEQTKTPFKTAVDAVKDEFCFRRGNWVTEETNGLVVFKKTGNKEIKTIEVANIIRKLLKSYQTDKLDVLMHYDLMCNEFRMKRSVIKK